jgi:hypothetical protein
VTQRLHQQTGVSSAFMNVTIMSRAWTERSLNINKCVTPMVFNITHRINKHVIITKHGDKHPVLVVVNNELKSSINS